MQEARLAGAMREASEMEVGGTIFRSRRYISFITDLLTMILSYMERNIEFRLSVDITPALSSCTPLMRFM